MRLNSYTCTKCKKVIVTKDIHKGTTPFMITCRATEGCDGTMESAFYSRIPANTEPTWGWYRRSDTRNMSTDELDYHNNGGLFILKLQTPECERKVK